MIDTSEKLLRFLDPRVENLKASPGVIISKRSSSASNQKIKVTPDLSGLALTITHNRTIQKLKIFTNEPDLIQLYIKDFCNDNDIQLIVS